MGYSSPVVWKDKLFTATALNETQEKVLLCYNCKNGESFVAKNRAQNQIRE